MDEEQETHSGGLVVGDARREDLAFLVDCNAAMALETEQRALDRDVLERGIAAILAQPQRGFYLIAQQRSAARGCLLITPEWSDWRNGEWWWLQSVYVLPAARRSGVFRALHAEVVRRARRRRDVVGLRLYVDQGNTRAQATYSAIGMPPARYRLHEDEFEHA